MAKSPQEIEYDANAVDFLSQKVILAHILRGTVKEFKGMSIEEIITCIEGEPNIHGKTVDAPEKDISYYVNGCNPMISGMDTSSKSKTEGNILYDILFFVKIPGEKGLVKLIINVESQNEVEHLPYDVVTRGFYYNARSISNQKNVEFIHQNYQDIKKVYSIWLCIRSNKDTENTITEYSITKKDIFGHYPREDYYDLMSVIQVCLSKEIVDIESGSLQTGPELLRLLETFFSSKICQEERENIIYGEYDIPRSPDMERSLRIMCNASQGIKNEGRVEGIEEGFVLLSTAVKKARENHFTTAEQLVEAGFDKKTADAAIELL